MLLCVDHVYSKSGRIVQQSDYRGGVMLLLCGSNFELLRRASLKRTMQEDSRILDQATVFWISLSRTTVTSLMKQFVAASAAPQMVLRSPSLSGCEADVGGG